MALRSFSSSNAAAQKCRCRISLSRGSTSYSMSSRSMVARCASHDGVGHEMRQFGQFARARFDGMQRFGAPGQRFGMVLVIGRGARVEIPAIVIEAHRRVGQHGAHVGRASSVPGNGSPPPRRPPARRCCRCNSALPRGSPRARSMRTKVSPSMALRRCPMCAALLGLMLVCSTMSLSPADAARRFGVPRSSAAP